MSRRTLLGSAAATAGGAAALGFGIERSRHGTSATPPAMGQVPDGVPCLGEHQAGIETAPQTHAMLVAADLTLTEPDTLRRLLQDLSATVERITQGQDPPHSPLYPDGAAVPTDFATGLSPARLTVTVGLGPRVFEMPGLVGSRPRRLRRLPEFDGDALDPRWSDGDLFFQICSDDPQIVSWAYRSLRARIPGHATLRWTQSGFTSAPRDGQTPRNMFGHKDGTTNPVPCSPAFASAVWALPDEPEWFAGGSYLVVRKIRMKTADWDLTRRDVQDQVIGRRRSDGSPLTGSDEFDKPDLAATGPDGRAIIAPDAHIRRVGDFTMFRRSYNYDYGQLIATAGGSPVPSVQVPDHTHAPGTPEHTHGGHGTIDVGLLFCAYGNDPDAQFIPAQRRSAASDRLSEFVQHTGSAMFAMLPGFSAGGYLGETLLA